MNKKSLFTCVLGIAVALSSCSSDDPKDMVQKDNAITFSAVAPKGSRAASTTTATLNEFLVYAFTENTVLMDGVKVSRSGGSWTYSPEAYWPVEPVNFYAVSPDISDSASIDELNMGKIPNYVSQGNVDLLYSVKKNVAQQAAPVLLNFRHALSKLNVMMSSNNQRITVKVRHVLLANFYLEGTFNFPDQSTLASTPDVVGNWTMLKNLNRQLLFYAVGDGDEVTLTPQPTDYTENNVDFSFVVPQPLAETKFEGGNYSGTYIQVDCEIFDTASGVKLWPNSKTPSYMLVADSPCGRIVYPASSDKVKSWEPGHAYVYNIVIDNPDVLDKIEFDVSVDDYSIDEIN